jgi:hypothetical protein
MIIGQMFSLHYLIKPSCCCKWILNGRCSGMIALSLFDFTSLRQLLFFLHCKTLCGTFSQETPTWFFLLSIHPAFPFCSQIYRRSVILTAVMCYTFVFQFIKIYFPAKYLVGQIRKLLTSSKHCCALLSLKKEIKHRFNVTILHESR